MNWKRDNRQLLIVWVVLVAATVTGLLGLRHLQKRRRMRQRIVEIVNDRCRHHRIDPALVMAVIEQESEFNPDVRGAAGEYGLMQVTRGAAADWERLQRRPLPSDGLLFTPEVNLEIGIWYLSRAMNQFANHPYQVELALSQYNAGRVRALRWASEYPENLPARIPIDSTRHYIASIVQRRQEFRQDQQVSLQ